MVSITDSLDEFARILEMLYSGGPSQYFDKESHVEYPAIITMLRPGLKYQITHIHNEAMRLLEICFPTTLEDWEELYTPGSKPMPIHSTYGNAIVFLNLARSSDDLKFMLPAAFYRCNKLEPSILIHSTELSDGTFERMTSEDQILALQFKDMLSSEVTKALRPLFQTCPSGNRTCQRIVLANGVFGLQISSHKDPFHAIHRWLPAQLSHLTICAGCTTGIDDIWAKNKVKIWAEMGKFCGVTDWPTAEENQG